ncbi:MAG: hypothetical protein GY949_11725 [Gammaproteobacteria bacterium]|nr:hypothetical protein [Gammaproteobacteria bacterium]
MDIAATGESENNAQEPSPHTLSVAVPHSNQPGKKFQEIEAEILGKAAIKEHQGGVHCGGSPEKRQCDGFRLLAHQFE